MSTTRTATDRSLSTRLAGRMDARLGMLLVCTALSITTAGLMA
ncbi:MAG: hypothetical protein VX641_02005 [Planctomycetota bacterium]|nr:hypothetical protein [Planctomycetota bacterium]